ncbi:YccF domain-containing protein [Deinococcus marmoris]|uniref:YccF domain-containing protein n=1 Tax=Deinococcus marmoris TaxID=249408 RepID=UPI0004966792|nr:YccF domain-containing protein [Deinococcus marmoris]
MTTPDLMALTPVPSAALTPMPANSEAELRHRIEQEERAKLQPLTVPMAPAELSLRERIEQEELAKFQEEQMRAEIRARLTAQHFTPVAQLAPATAPAPIIVNVTNSNVATATASATVGSAAASKHPSTIIRVLYFCFFGWWIGPTWLLVAVLLCCSVIGLPIGVLMFSKTVDAFFL